MLYSSTIIHPNVRSVVYCYGIKQGGVTEWEFIYNRFLTELVASEKIKLLSSLGCTDEEWLLQRFTRTTSLLSSLSLHLISISLRFPLLISFLFLLSTLSPQSIYLYTLSYICIPISSSTLLPTLSLLSLPLSSSALFSFLIFSLFVYPPLPLSSQSISCPH